jgi:hypothetical protein
MTVLFVHKVPFTVLILNGEARWSLTFLKHVKTPAVLIDDILREILSFIDHIFDKLLLLKLKRYSPR